ncbi:MAG TPA: M42 family peptidase, partial [Thermotogales bacterium]|nr:M42 family peptidase [Thermotogales bacterium]
MRYLKELSEIPGVSGDEMRVREFIREKIIGKVDELFIDNLGNLIAFKKGKRKNRSKVMVLAHMDEVGFMVTRLNEDGTLSFLPVGGVKPEILPGKRVKVVREGVRGVIGFKAVHLQKEDEMNKLPRWDDLRIDAGFESKDEAEKNV